MAEKKTASRAEKAVSEAKKKNPSAGSASQTFAGSYSSVSCSRFLQLILATGSFSRLLP